MHSNFFVVARSNRCHSPTLKQVNCSAYTKSHFIIVSAFSQHPIVSNSELGLKYMYEGTAQLTLNYNAYTDSEFLCLHYQLL